jgi:hypothetical protein
MDPATEAADAWWRPRANDAGVNASALQDASLLRAAAPALELVVAYLASNASALLDDALERLPAVAQKVSETIQIHSRKCHSHQTRLVTSPRAVASAFRFAKRSMRARSASHAQPVAGRHARDPQPPRECPWPGFRRVARRDVARARRPRALAPHLRLRRAVPAALRRSGAARNECRRV